MPNRSERSTATGYAFVLPAFVLLTAVLVFPYLYAIFLSLHRLSPTLVPKFVRLGNFVKVLNDRAFLTVVQNQLVLVIASGILQFLLGMAGSLALNRLGSRSNILRGALLVPWAIPGVVAALLWRWILDGHSGILNYLLVSIGVLDKPISWLADEVYTMGSLILVNVWRVFPFNMVMFLAGLQTIPQEQIDAALVDGATGFQMFCHVTLPNLRQVIMVTTILTAIWNFKIFDVVWTLTKGGPGGATEVFSTMIYRSSFIRLDFGYASAVAVIMAIVLSVPIVLYMKLGKED